MKRACKSSSSCPEPWFNRGSMEYKALVLLHHGKNDGSMGSLSMDLLVFHGLIGSNGITMGCTFAYKVVP
jgi:hypothetical protein